MSSAAAVALIAGLVFATGLAAAAVHRARHRQPPWAVLALAAVAGSNALLVLWAPEGSDVPPVAVAFAFLAWVAVLLTYPDGRVQPRWAAPALALLAVALGVQAARTGDLGSGAWPLLLLACLVGGGAAQVWRFARRSSTAEREAVQWALVGIVPALSFLVGLDLMIATTSLTARVYDDAWVAVATHMALWSVPVAGTVGLLRPRFPAPDRALVVVFVVNITALVLVETHLVLTPVVGPGWAAAVVVLAEIPVLLLSRAAASFLVYGGTASPALVRLGARLEGAIGPDQVPGTVAEALRSALHAPYAAVRLHGGGVAELGQAPADGAAAETFPVTYGDRTVATLAVAARHGERGLSGRDRAVVRRLAGRAGAALHGAATVADLRAAREELLRAREDERRRLRRDLHDDLAPTLAGLGLRAAAVTTLVATDPRRAATVAERLEEGILRAVDQVRDIAYGLRPPVLDDHGLVAALRQRVVADDSASPMAVTVTAAPDLGELPAAVEVAALRIAQESVANARRHAGATRCKVSLSRDDGHLRVEVTDDGHGFSAGVRAGIGLRSIAERSAELGGTSDLSSGPSGTTVAVRLPLRPSG